MGVTKAGHRKKLLLSLPKVDQVFFLIILLLLLLFFSIFFGYVDFTYLTCFYQRKYSCAEETTATRAVQNSDVQEHVKESKQRDFVWSWLQGFGHSRYHHIFVAADISSKEDLLKLSKSEIDSLLEW